MRPSDLDLGGHIGSAEVLCPKAMARLYFVPSVFGIVAK
jgi:hypothetical protein